MPIYCQKHQIKKMKTTSSSAYFRVSNVLVSNIKKACQGAQLPKPAKLWFVCCLIMVCMQHSSPLKAQEVPPQQVHQVIETVAQSLTDNYPFPEIAGKYAKMLRAGEKKYQHMDEATLARNLTIDLHKVHKDAHLVVYKEEKQANDNGASTNETEEDILRRNGYGFKTVELDNTTATAYISIPYGFQCTQEAYEMAGHAMNMATYSKYIIIDLRGNPGGSGNMGHFLASYFFEPGEEAFYLDGFEKQRKNIQEHTYGYVPGKRLTKSKLFIIADQNTASASEGFAFAMQKLHKATIVGVTTAGAGIAGQFVDLQGSLKMFLPTKMVIEPGTMQGWEGTGVIPDVNTGDKDALQVTRELIAEDIKHREN